MRGLTRKQAVALAFIWERLANGPVTPTLQEIADVIGVRHRSGAHRAVEILIEHGYLVRSGHGLQAMEVPANAPPLAIVERRTPRIIRQTVVLGAVSEHPPADKAKLITTRKKRTYVVELERDLNHRLRKIAETVSAPPERIIAMALRDFIMERGAA